MDKLIAFKVFCLENYKTIHNLTGKTALDIFQKNNVFDYISSYFDVLHSFGRLYIVKDIDDFIANSARDSGPLNNNPPSVFAKN